MAGLYRQTYKQKPTVKLAPDAVVLVNEKKDVEICPSCQGRLVLSDYITSVSTNLANNTTVGTASFTISIPKHGHHGNFMVRGGRVFGINLMDEVEIFIKARYPYNEDGDRQYYQSFWGLVVNIQESYSDGFQNITVNCESILKWLQLMKTNEHPSLITIGDSNTKIDLFSSLYTGKTYAELNPYQIIYQMVNLTYLNIVVPSALDQETPQTPTSEGKSSDVVSPKDIELMSYWSNRFAKVKGNLRMFGTTPDDFLKAETAAQDAVANTKNDSRLAASQNPVSPIAINYNSKALMDFKPFLKPDDRSQIGVIHNTYKNNLEIINEVKLATGYEFYLDTNGELIFKPPFWNLDVKKNKTYVLEDLDIISWDFSEDANEVVTRIDVTGQTFQEKATSHILSPRATFTDYKLARQYGIKSEQISARFFTTPQMCYYHAVSEMDRINANRYRASLTIIGRPELRLGYPVYIRSRDIYGYVDNISHNFTFGGQFTTNIELSGIRRKYLGDSTIASQFKFIGEGTRSSGFIGNPAILINTAEPEFEKAVDSLLKDANVDVRREINNRIAKTNQTAKQRSRAVQEEKNDFYKSNKNGNYEEFLLTDPLAQRTLQIAQRAKNQNNQEAYLNFLEVAIPISDEDGYELIGVFENGRSIELTQSNILRKKGKSFSEILANVLKGANNNSNFDVNQVTPIDTTTSKAIGGTIEDKEKRDQNSENTIKDFSKTKARSLRDLSPNSKDIKTCNCYDKGLTANLPSDFRTEARKLMKNAGNARNRTRATNEN